MSNNEDRGRAASGAAKWNAWAEIRSESSSVDLSNDTLEIRDFSSFVFPGSVIFDGTRFAVDVSFRGACFKGPVFFRGAVFENADFRSARFENEVHFSNVRSFLNADFSLAYFASESHWHQVQFTESANFRNATFQEFANFEGTRFLGASIFEDAIFREAARFRGASFLKQVSFQRTKFSGDADFSGSSFIDPRTDFSAVQFAKVPDFRSVEFKVTPNLHDSKVRYAVIQDAPWWQRALKRAQDAEDAARYRRLKQLAADAKDHEQELKYFAMELRAKRFWTKSPFGADIVNLLYDWVSSFGQSVGRPVLVLLSVTALSTAILYMSATPTIDSPYSEQPAAQGVRVVAAFRVALSNIALLIGGDKWGSRAAAVKQLWGSESTSFGALGDLAALGQSAVSLFLIFLIGLGLRNRFRIGGGGG